MTNVGGNKLLPKFIGPFRVLHRLGNAYTIELSRKMCTHPTFYVGCLRPYYQYEASSGKRHPLALKHLQQILVLTMLALNPRLKFGYLPVKPRDILTSFHQLVAERTLFPLIRQLSKGILFPVLLPI